MTRVRAGTDSSNGGSVANAYRTPKFFAFQPNGSTRLSTDPDSTPLKHDRV